MSLLVLILYVSLLTLNLLDGHSTWRVLRPRHLSRERNPLARWIFSKLGVLRGIIVAEMLWMGFITAVVFLALGLGSPILEKLLPALLILGNLVFLIVVISNYLVLRKIRRDTHRPQDRPPRR